MCYIRQTVYEQFSFAQNDTMKTTTITTTITSLAFSSNLQTNKIKLVVQHEIYESYKTVCTDVKHLQITLTQYTIIY